ncbi:ABC transporter substrate-binding protein [Streptomyces sp. NPDC006879]|uniref:ABC transporter family substrate-binding protein n=1 Tax=Streptomyces sp. NPDC006879 TaxID=3364767 RepID=UPI0036A30890
MSVRRRRPMALLTSGFLALPLLAGCGSPDGEALRAVAVQDVAATGREAVADGGVLRWAIDAMPQTLNTFQADADAATARVAGAVLPALFTLDKLGRPVRNPDYLESAEVIEREPKQVVLYKLNQQAVWSDGREIGAPDFLAQWRALSGKNSAYWTARNAGYERIEKIERGANDLEVKVTFGKPYADWQSLFTPLYPKQVTGAPDDFNDGARSALKVTAGPFGLGAIDKKAKTITLDRNPRWWGQPAKLDTLVLTAVSRGERPAALAAGRLDLAEIDRAGAQRIALAAREAKSGPGGRPAHGPGSQITTAQALRSWAVAHGSDEEAAEAERSTRQHTIEAASVYATEQSGLRALRVRKSLEPAYTQLALNGSTGALGDERVRRAVARAIDRKELAETVLKPLGLPAAPVGSHLALAGQHGYADASGALGGQDVEAAQALLAEAGWQRGGPVREEAEAEGQKAGAEAEGAKDDGKTPQAGDGTGEDGLYIVGQEDEANGDAPGAERMGGAEAQPATVLAPAPFSALQQRSLIDQATFLDGRAQQEESDGTGEEAERGRDDGKRAEEATGEPKSSPAPGRQAVRSAGNLLAKDGKEMKLRFVLPSGPGSEQLRNVGDRIAAMLLKVGIRTQITKVEDDSFFKDHIASGQFDLALYSWPATAFPATDARPIFAKPEPAADGSLSVEQNYSRVGTDRIDQLFDEAVAELDAEAARELMKQADARIWAAAGSIPLFQRPELVAARNTLLNAGAFGLATPRYQDIGWKPGSKGPEAPKVDSKAGAAAKTAEEADGDGDED